MCSTANYEPQYDVSVAAALNLDDRVPATVITGFLGSGKVGINIFYARRVQFFFPSSNIDKRIKSCH